MTNTIPNVPRELLERAWRALANSATGREIGAYLDADPCAPGCAETCVRASMCAACSADLSAPSPAGVDGLVAVKVWEADADWDDHELVVRLSAAQAIIDGLRGEVAAQRVKTCTALKERDAAATECERSRMQLVACGVVALSNTIESAGKARQMHPDYMSASCSDVAGAVDREIALRTERDQQAQRIGELERALLEVAASLAWNAHGECRAIHDGPIMPSKMAIDVAKAALSAGKEGE